ncbi:adenylate dimethylallyltransferase (ADP/ATP-dependent) [Bertholletia excelsa]
MGTSVVMCNQVQPLFNIPASKEKVAVVMGATGTGKSRLAVDLAAHFFGEVINSDKIQAYRGLAVATNKVTEEERRGIPHHLLDFVDPHEDFTAGDFRHAATLAVRSIISRRHLPIVAGGSNSYIEDLIDGGNRDFRNYYDCCFIWVDVSPLVLRSFISDRVDRMVENGLVNEIGQIFDLNSDYSRGIKRAIGVSELDFYFRSENFLVEEARNKVLKEAIDEIKSNTCKLAEKQMAKIQRLREVKGWKLHRLDATEAFWRRNGGQADAAWEELVAAPGKMIVSRFLPPNCSPPVARPDRR